MSELQELENELEAAAKNDEAAVAQSTEVRADDDTPSASDSEPQEGTGTPQSNHGATESDGEIAKLREALARSQADYKNLAARTERERLEMADYVTEKIVSKLLPNVDNLERLISGTPETERTGALYEGVKSTHAGIVRSLEAAGIASFESVGQPLDPDFHEAVAQVPGAEGVVIAEFEKGYKLRDKVIRHAKVTVGNGA